MRRDLFIHFTFWFFFFLFISFFRNTLILSYWPFWVGGVVGVILPDVDHLIYVLFLKPQELTSQRFHFLLERKEMVRSVELLYETTGERSGLIFHSIFFQLIFFALTVLVFSSSAPLFAKGLVLSFLLHLSVDQLTDLKEVGNLQGWIQSSSLSVSSSISKVYLIGTIILICVFSILV